MCDVLRPHQIVGALLCVFAVCVCVWAGGAGRARAHAKGCLSAAACRKADGRIHSLIRQAQAQRGLCWYARTPDSGGRYRDSTLEYPRRYPDGTLEYPRRYPRVPPTVP